MLETFFPGWGGFGGDAFKLLSESLEEALAVLKTFSPKRCSTLSFTGKSFGWGSQLLGGCFTIMMCYVFGVSFSGGCFQINV